MLEPIHFAIEIEPVAKGRPRFGKGRAYTPTKTRRFEESVRSLSRAYAPLIPYEGPIKLTVFFYLERPSSVKRDYPICRPDLDNFQKGVLDGLNKLFWKDDAQVITIEAHKRYSERDHGKIYFEIEFM